MKRSEIYAKCIAAREKFVSPQYQPDAELNLAPKSGNIERIVFAPDPVTGLPMSDLSLPLDVANDPSVREYVDKWLHRNMADRAEQSNIMNVDDFDPDTIKPRRAQFGTERDSYITGLRDKVETYYRNQSELRKMKKEKGITKKGEE